MKTPKHLSPRNTDHTREAKKMKITKCNQKYLRNKKNGRILIKNQKKNKFQIWMFMYAIRKIFLDVLLPKAGPYLEVEQMLQMFTQAKVRRYGMHTEHKSWHGTRLKYSTLKYTSLSWSTQSVPVPKNEQHSGHFEPQVKWFPPLCLTTASMSRVLNTVLAYL